MSKRSGIRTEEDVPGSIHPVTTDRAPTCQVLGRPWEAGRHALVLLKATLASGNHTDLHRQVSGCHLSLKHPGNIEGGKSSRLPLVQGTRPGLWRPH